MKIKQTHRAQDKGSQSDCCQVRETWITETTDYVHFTSLTVPYLPYIDCAAIYPQNSTQKILLLCTHLLICSTLSSSILPHPPTCEQRFSTLWVVIPIICYQRQSCAIIIEHKMVPWYCESFLWMTERMGFWIASVKCMLPLVDEMRPQTWAESIRIGLKRPE